MSGIVGIFNRDGRPIGDDRTVRRMLDAIAYRGPDASHVWTEGPVALGHCLLRTTPESIAEQQPHHLRGEGLSIVFDGRIDNREELVERFDRERVRPPAADFDAAFALTAYQLWGEACPAELLGDFAFAIWDARRRRFFCARDVIGLKGFYYHCGPDVFLFASEPQALLRHPAVSRRPNEGMVGEYLSVVTSYEDTLFADIQRLAPAGCLSVSADQRRVDKHWEIDFNKEIRYKTVDEYGEHLRSLLREAVRARLRSCSTVGVMLSGGVDSSSLLGMATSLMRDGEVSTRCEAFSLVADGVLDESHYFGQVARMNGCRAHTFVGDVPSAAEYRRMAKVRADVPPMPNGRVANTLKLGAEAAGIRVLLSGVWGDEWFTGSYYHCADLFRSFRWLRLGREVRIQSRFPEVPIPGPLPKILFWPLLPRPWRKRIKLLIGRDGVPRWVRRDFARRIGLADRLYPSRSEPPFPTIAQRTIYEEGLSALATLATEEEDRTAAEFGIETRHPFADRRVMEFGMAIPEDLRWQNGVKKFILREAMRRYLPDEVRRRLTSADGSAVFLRPLRELVAEGLLISPAVEREGWINAPEVRALYENTVLRHDKGDPSYGDDIWPLWSIAGVEIWMQGVVEDERFEEDSCTRTSVTT